VSVNITIFSITGAGSNGVFQVGTANNPTFAWINYPSTESQRGNAGVVPLSSSGQIVVKVNQGGGSLHFTVDTNGYFPATTTTNPLTLGEWFGIVGSLGGGGVIQGTNSNSAANSYGVKGVASGTGSNSAGIFGLASGTSGVLYGTLGQETSTTADSAGIRGVNGAGSPGGFFAPAGVRGESAGGFGVLGTSGLVGTAGLAGVNGAFLNSSGTTVAEGRLGFSTGGSYYGVYSTTGDIGATGTKQFVVPHPTDPNIVIRYISLEGPEAGTYFRGRARLEGRMAIIDIPESFRLVTEEDGLSIQVTPIGGPASLWIQEIGLDRIMVRGPRDIEFFYTVNGVRKGYGAFEPMSQGSEFVPQSPSSRLPEGLSPETKRRLIANGTYNPDGTVNMETAERMGWTKLWAAR
jgi:hypothetical protein